MKIEATRIAYRDGDAELTGLLISDSAMEHNRPGVLVVHAGAGLDDHAKEQAVRLAKLGFVVLACDMYGHRVARNRELVLARINELRHDPTKSDTPRGAGGLVSGAASKAVVPLVEASR